MSDLEDNVQKLLKKAADAERSEDALRFSQAALNSAHTKHAMVDLPKPRD